jgi:hypothetical protein
MMICLVMAANSMLAPRIALVVEVVATGKKVQTGTQQRNGADNRQQQLGGELPIKSHKGHYFLRM